MKQQFLILPPPHCLATTILLSVCMNLTTIGTYYKWNHTIFIFLLLT